MACSSTTSRPSTCSAASCATTTTPVVNFHQQALKARLALHTAILAAHSKLSKGQPAITKECHARLLAEHRAAKTHKGVPAAVRFFVILAHSFNAKFGSYAATPTFRQPNALLHPLPENLKVRRADAMEVLRSVAEHGDARMCLYLDPPYSVAFSLHQVSG